MNRPFQLCCASTALVLLLGGGVSQLQAADWPQFRGASRDGLSTESPLDLDWSDGDPKELWRLPIGEGYAAISVVGDHLYTADSHTIVRASVGSDGDADGGQDQAEVQDGEAPKPSGTEFALALNARTGEMLWRASLGSKTFNEFGHGTRATPTVDGDRVVYLSGEGVLSSLDRASGDVKWSVDLKEAYGSVRPRYGFSSSALVDGDQILLDVGGAEEGQSHVALESATGALRWSSGETGRSGAAGYSSPLAVEFGGVRQFVHKAGASLRAVDRAGQELWSFELPQGEAHSMPIFVPPNRIYASGATPVGAVMVEIESAEDGYQATEVWSTHLMRNHFSTSVYIDGYLYGFDNATLKCLDAATGKQLWAKRGLGKGSLIAAEGHLIVLADQGRLLVAPATPEGFVESGSVQALSGKSWTAPSLANGILYLRNHSEIVAYDLNAGADS